MTPPEASESPIAGVCAAHERSPLGTREPIGEAQARETRDESSNARSTGLERRDHARGSSLASDGVIFFGNGPLADYALAVLTRHFNVIFHVRTKADLATAASIKQQHPSAHAVLASYGVLIKPDFLQLFEPEGILNIHPSLLPKYRGASPIETAILQGDHSFSVSIMKLTAGMDSGPIYYQTTLTPDHFSQKLPDKLEIYRELAEAGADWLVSHLSHLPVPSPQDSVAATYTQKLTKSLSPLDPTRFTATQLLNQIRAFQGFPKSKYTFSGVECIILSAHVTDTPSAKQLPLSLKCIEGRYLVIDSLQPAGKRPMDAQSFLNGYVRR